MRNVRWLLSQQVIRLVVGFLIGSWMARTLGPADFGVLCASHAVAAILYAAVELGWRPMVLAEMSARSRLREVLAGTVFWLWLGSALVTVAGASWWNWATGTRLPWWVFFAAMCPLLCFPFTVQHLWEEAEQRAFVPARNQTAGYATGAVLRVGSLLWWAQLPVVAWTIAAEFLVSTVLSMWIGLRRGRGALLLAWNSRVAKTLLSRTGWLALFQVGNMLILRLDSLLLERWWGAHETGLYSAAVRLSEIGTAGSASVMVLLLPRLSKLLGDESRFRKMTAVAADALTTLGLVGSLGLLVGGPVVLRLLFGEKYAGSIPVLEIHCFSILTYFIWEWRNTVLICMGRLSSAAWLAVSGAAMNVLLNAVLIPAHGAVGAAWATVLAYGLAGLVLSWIMPQQRWLALSQTKALLAPVRCALWPKNELRTWREVLSA